MRGKTPVGAHTGVERGGVDTYSMRGGVGGEFRQRTVRISIYLRIYVCICHSVYTSYDTPTKPLPSTLPVHREHSETLPAGAELSSCTTSAHAY